MAKKNEKIKFIDYLLKGNGTLTEKYELRKNRLNRAIKAAIDNANEMIIDNKIRANNAIEDIKYNLDSTDGIMNCLNTYLDYMEDVSGYNRAKENLEALQKRLSEDVEVEVDAEK